VQIGLTAAIIDRQMWTHNAVDVRAAEKEAVQAGLRPNVEVLEVVAFRVDQLQRRDRPVTGELEVDELVIPGTLHLLGHVTWVRGLCSWPWGPGAQKPNAGSDGRIAVQRPVHCGDAPEGSTTLNRGKVRLQ
jgi:hypothetical protein